MPKSTPHIPASQLKKFSSYEEIKQTFITTPIPQKKRVPHRDLEHQLQASCYAWFISKYPGLYRLLFAIPNGGQRNAIVAAKLKAEGTVKGVADLFLSIPSKDAHGLYIEMKTLARSSRQSPEQKDFQNKVTCKGYRYEVIRSKEEFEDLIETYLNDT